MKANPPLNANSIPVSLVRAGRIAGEGSSPGDEEAQNKNQKADGRSGPFDSGGEPPSGESITRRAIRRAQSSARRHMLQPPRATARLQMHADFTLDDACAQVDYFAKLGISHLYLSPIFTARPGSTHGYDIVDFSTINPELGGEPALRRLSTALHQRGMGIILDIVPNHMGVDLAHNHWWRDVLQHGQHSAHAGVFDIDWNSPEQEGKLLLPILGDPLGQVIDAGDLRLDYSEASRQFELAVYEHRLPLSDDSQAQLARAAAQFGIAAVLEAHTSAVAADVNGDQSGDDRLLALLDQQHYRLAWWRTAADELNWRRFFEITDLAGLRIERTEVMDAVHALTFSLYREGVIDGVRVDHVDGLADPAAYCKALRRRLTGLHRHRPPGSLNDQPWIVVEKILADGEQMPADWPIDGSTGYDFMNDVLRVLHDPSGEASLDALWHLSVGRNDDFASEARRARHQMLTENLVSEFHALARRLHRLASTDMRTRDITVAMIERSLGALLENFPVYRTYITEPGRLSAQDLGVFRQALLGARQTLRTADHQILELVEGWLGANALADEHLPAQQAAIVKFQQLSSPLAAKSTEDTAFYRYNRLLSLNEVGGDPGSFCIGVDDFHRRIGNAARLHPDRMLATATHDHKRGEDLRARLAVLSEIAPTWAETVSEWRRDARAWRAQHSRPNASGVEPSSEDELAMLQTLVGAWPLGLTVDDKAGVQALLERVEAWNLKAVREAKVLSSWIAPDEDYENACHDFLFDLADMPSGERNLLARIAEFAARISAAGALNGLSQQLLRVTVPGVPDLYQGTELWDFSLVDPDNRRPVDFAARRSNLDQPVDLAQQLREWHDGRIKQLVLRRALNCRRELPELFARGDYLPLRTVGRHGDRVLAFARRDDDRCALVVVSRLAASLLDGQIPLVAADAWGDTRILLDPEMAALEWTDQLCGNTLRAGKSGLLVSQVLSSLPVSLLVDGLSGITVEPEPTQAEATPAMAAVPPATAENPVGLAGSKDEAVVVPDPG